MFPSELETGSFNSCFFCLYLQLPPNCEEKQQESAMEELKGILVKSVVWSQCVLQSDQGFTG